MVGWIMSVIWEGIFLCTVYTIILTVFPLNDAFGSLVKKCKQQVLLCGEHLSSAEMKMNKMKCSVLHPADHYPASSEIDKGMGDTALTCADLGSHLLQMECRRATVNINTKQPFPLWDSKDHAYKLWSK